MKFTAAPDSPFNGAAIILASVTDVGSYPVSINVVGTTVDVSLIDNENTVTVTTTSTQLPFETRVANSAGLGVYGVSVNYEVYGDKDFLTAAPAGATVSPNPAVTDISGVATAYLSGSATGQVYVKAYITDIPNGETYDSQVFQIQDQLAFQIVSPVPSANTDYVELVSGVSSPSKPNPLQIKVTAGLNNVQAGQNVVFATTVGNFGGSATFTTPFVDDGNGSTASAIANLTATSTDHGFATVYAFYEPDSTRYDSLKVAISPPVSDAANITIQPETETLFPNSGSTTFSTKIKIKVYTDVTLGNYPIANVPVVLQLQNSTGGGEFLQQAFGYTDVYGFFETNLVSGVTSTGQEGVKIIATVQTDPTVTAFTTVEIGGTAGSVAIGTPREVFEDDNNSSINTYVMSALVADGTGAAVSGAQVTLHFWPTYYYTGFWAKVFNPVTGDDEWSPVITGTFKNEDLNENGVLDPGEDVNLNGQLDPPASYGGAGPPTVTTGTNGAAPFNFVYLKDSAEWVKVRASGSTLVFGTEAKTAMEFIPKSILKEVAAGNVNDSPFKLWLLVSVSDPTGTAYYPGTLIPYTLTGATAAKGSFGTSNEYQLPAVSGPYLAGDTETDRISDTFDIYIRYVP